MQMTMRWILIESSLDDIKLLLVYSTSLGLSAIQQLIAVGYEPSCVVHDPVEGGNESMIDVQ